METETRARGIVVRGTVRRMRENTCDRFVARGGSLRVTVRVTARVFVPHPCRHLIGRQLLVSKI